MISTSLSRVLQETSTFICPGQTNKRAVGILIDTSITDNLWRLDMNKEFINNYLPSFHTKVLYIVA